MIFIDFDDTIYNTKRFKEEYYKMFEKSGVLKDVFEQTYYSENEKTDGLIYDFEKHLDRIEAMTLQNMTQLRKDLNYFLKDTSRFVFNDFNDFSKSFSKQELFLVSFGHQPFQGVKIKSSGIEKFFKKIIVTNGKKSLIIKQLITEFGGNGKVYFVDDRPDQLEDVLSEIDDVVAIRVKRGQGRYKDLACKNEKVKQVRSLKQAGKFIKKTKT